MLARTPVLLTSPLVVGFFACSCLDLNCLVASIVALLLPVFFAETLSLEQVKLVLNNFPRPTLVSSFVQRVEQ